MSDPETIRVYNAEARRYAELTGAAIADEPDFQTFIAACPRGGRVLDFGCGPGQAAAEMARQGLQADAMDLSAEMVALASRHPDVTVWQAGFDALEAEALYDGIWASFSLLHAPRSAFPGHLAQIKRALKPRGIFYIGMKTGAGTKRDNIGRHYTYYTPEALEQHLTDAGFTVTGRRTGHSMGLDGVTAPWVTMIAHG